MPLCSVMLRCTYDSQYSYAWQHRKVRPSRMVRPRKPIRRLRLPTRKAWCAIVTVTLEDNNSSVLSSGIPHGEPEMNEPPTACGPLVGHVAEKPCQIYALVITPLSPMPPSHGTTKVRMYNRPSK